MDNAHAVQDQYDLRPLSAYGKPFTQLAGMVDASIPITPGPSPQANALDGEKFFTKAAKWFNKVPFPAEDEAAGIDKVLAQFGIVHGQPFDYAGLSVEKKVAMGLAVKAVQREFEKIAADPASIGTLKQGWLIPNPNLLIASDGNSFTGTTKRKRCTKTVPECSVSPNLCTEFDQLDGC